LSLSNVTYPLFIKKMKIVLCTLRKWATTRSSVVAFPTSCFSTSSTTASSPVVTNSFLRNITSNNNPTFNCSRRQFSSESTESSSKSALLEILAREEQEEAEIGNTELPTELLDLKTTIEESWKIVEDGATTDLYKIDNTSNNAKIQVSFHCQDTIEAVDVGELDYGDDDEDDDDEVLHEDDNDEDVDDEVSSPVRFTATVTKAGKSLVFACFSELGQVRIEGVSTTAKSTPEYVHENQGTRKLQLQNRTSFITPYSQYPINT